MKLIFFFLTLFIIPFGNTQIKTPLFYSVQTKTGFLIAHRPIMSHLIQDRNNAIELNISQQMTDHDIWSKIYKNPMRGVSFSYQDFGNKEVLGQAFSLFQHSSFNLLRSEKWGFVDFRLGAGISYITKKYSVESNPKNNAIGSNLNAIVDVQFAWTKYFKKWSIGTGIEISHYSNAALVKPNLGLNTPLIFINLGFHPLKRVLPEKKWEIAENSDYELQSYPSFFNFNLITTMKQNLPGQNPSRFYPVLGLQALYSHNLNYKWNVEGSLDFIYNAANRNFYDDISYSAFDALQVGAYFGAAANFMKTQVYFGFGGYLVNTINPSGNFYNRIGYRYHFGKKWTGMIGIMANLGKADYLEFGFGYQIDRKTKPKKDNHRKKSQKDT